MCCDTMRGGVRGWERERGRGGGARRKPKEGSGVGVGVGRGAEQSYAKEERGKF